MRPFDLSPEDNTMYYILYDLRKDLDPVTSLINVHLPTAKSEGPVLLRVEADDYENIVMALREMCINEGNEWMTTMLIRPGNAPTNTGDLEVNGIYILIAHIKLFVDEPEGFMQKLKSMKRLVLH
jgi:hypothetical protein